MGIIKTYIAYHATDESNLSIIIENNFEFNPNDEHWLGNGIYFFKDPALAKHWGEQIPTTKYGEINKFVLIKAKIDVDDDFLCDMKLLDGYNYVK